MVPSVYSAYSGGSSWGDGGGLEPCAKSARGASSVDFMLYAASSAPPPGKGSWYAPPEPLLRGAARCTGIAA